MKVIHNEPDAFMEDMDKDAANIERKTIRVCYERRPSPNGVTTAVALVATYVHSFENHAGYHVRTVHELRRGLGDLWPHNTDYQQAVSERGDSIEKALAKAAKTAGLTVRTGRYMDGEGAPCQN